MVSKLKSIVNALCLTLLLLGSVSAKDLNTVEVEVMTKSSKSWDGEDLPSYARGKPEISILRIVIPPGATIPLHEHPVINAGVLLKGKLTVITKENRNRSRRYTLEPAKGETGRRGRGNTPRAEGDLSG